MNYKAGTFAVDVGGGAQSITGIGFKGKLVLFLPTRQTAAGTAGHASMSFGCADKDNQWAIHANSEDAIATSDTHREASTSLCILVNNPGVATALYEASFTTFDSDGFTINVTTAPASAYLVHYLVIGGDEMEVDVFNFVMPGATGDQSITGIGFVPEGLIFACMNSGSTDFNSAGAILAMGAASAPGEQGTTIITSVDGVGTSDAGVDQRTDRAIKITSANGGGATSARLKSFDDDGFTLTYLEGAAAAVVYGIAVRGFGVQVGSFLRNGALAEYDITNLDFRPAAGMLWSSCGIPATSRVADARLSASFFTDTEKLANEQFQSGYYERDGVLTMQNANSVAVDLIHRDINATSLAATETTDFV
ncbi:MAG: hypothetical protein ACYTBZ_30060, partial [Planctomycetota bacterium]